MSERVYTVFVHSDSVSNTDEGYIEGVFASAEAAVQYVRQTIGGSGKGVALILDVEREDGTHIIRLKSASWKGDFGLRVTVQSHHVQRMRGES